MSDFACHALESGGLQCCPSARGHTCYCHCHYSAFYCSQLFMMTRPQRRSSLWVYYDPKMISNLVPLRFLRTELIAFWSLALPIVAIGQWFFNFPSQPPTT